MVETDSLSADALARHPEDAIPQALHRRSARRRGWEGCQERAPRHSGAAQPRAKRTTRPCAIAKTDVGAGCQRQPGQCAVKSTRLQHV